MIDVKNLTLAFGDRDLFKGVSFQLGDKEKICLAGANGSGKTTLLKVLCGEMRPDTGAIVRSRSVEIGYLRQHLGEEAGATVFEAAREAFKETLERHRELEELRASLGDRMPGEAEMTRLDFLEDELIRGGYYTAESETRKVLSGLGFGADRQDAPLASLSGGWRMRVALARVLLARPTCLFLDEPTNHLDLESIVWLEGYIRNYPGSLILISHDRQFVDRTCERILEVQGGELAYYPLPYARYEEEKTVRQEQVLREYRKQQEEIESLERFISRFKAKATKAAQAQSKQKQLDRMERIELPSTLASIRLRFPEAPPSGQWVFEAEGLAKSYGENHVFADGKFGVRAGDKVVLVGPNGAGKTTLLKLILGLERPEAGAITRGSNVVTGYFAQYEEPTPAEAGMDLVSFLAASHPRIGNQQIRSILGSMLFSDDDAFKKFGVLSGGERARVRLCRLLLQNCNVLVLDEPTNHLDMDSKLLLLRALADFTGTVLFVSHDRYFVEKVATRVILVKDGRVTDYPGDYAYYLSKLQADQRSAADQKAADAAPVPAEKRPARASGGPRAAPPEPQSPAAPGTDRPGGAAGTSDWEARKEAERRKRKAEKRWGEIESEITDLDRRLAAIDKELCRPEVYADPAESARLAREKRAAEEAHALLFREWEQLESARAQGKGGE